jgi:hypothetical protein
MELDNSGANEFRRCPLLFQEGRLAEGTGLEQIPFGNEVTPLQLGSRVHELLEEYYRELQGNPRNPYPESNNAVLETEAQIIMAAYRSKYPQENFKILDVERPFRVGLPVLCKRCYTLTEKEVLPGFCNQCGDSFAANESGRHIYTGKIDVMYEENGELFVMDHKTEKRRSNSNRPQKWAAKDQATLYLWAARQIYKKPISKVVINILKRPSDKFQEGPIFPDRQRLERTDEQIKIALRDFVFICDEVERYKKVFENTYWPSNREECDSGWGQCPFYLPHTYGWSEDMRQLKYQPRTSYLELGGIPIIQP